MNHINSIQKKKKTGENNVICWITLLIYWIWLLLLIIKIIYDFYMELNRGTKIIYVYQYKNDNKLHFIGLIICNKFIKLKKIDSSNKLELCLGKKYKLWFQISTNEISNLIDSYKKVKKMSLPFEELYAIIKAGIIKSIPINEIFAAVIDSNYTTRTIYDVEDIPLNMGYGYTVTIGDKKMWAVKFKGPQH